MDNHDSNPKLNEQAHRIADGEALQSSSSDNNDTAAAAEAIRRIDAAVRRTHRAPTLPAVLAQRLGDAPHDEAREASSNRAAPGRLWLRAAAAVLLFGLGAVLVVQQLPKPRVIDAGAVYASIVPAMQPQHVCTTEAEFLAYSVEYLGEPIAADYGSGVEFVGWRTLIAGDYVAGVIGEGRMLLARGPDGEDAVVLMVRPEARVAVDVGGAAGLRAHEATLGGVRVIEVSRADRAVVLPALSLGE